MHTSNTRPPDWLDDLGAEITALSELPGFEDHVTRLTLVRQAALIGHVDPGCIDERMRAESIAINVTAAEFGPNMTSLVHVHSSRIWNMALADASTSNDDE